MSLALRALLAVAVLVSHPAASARAPVVARRAAAAPPSSAGVKDSSAPMPPSNQSSVSAEVAYPRSPDEARALGGQALLLVTATTTNSADLPLAPPILHLADGRSLELTQLAGETDDGSGDALAEPTLLFRYTGLYYLPLFATGTSAQISVGLGARRQVVIQFPRPASAYPPGWPVPEPGDFSTPVVVAFASKRYPFFRVPPLKSPAQEPTCPMHALDQPAARVEASAPAGSDKSTPEIREVHGSLNRSVIRGIIRAHLPEVRGCYEHELVKQQTLRGRVMVQFVVRRDGWVADSKLVNATIPSPPVSDCVVAVVRCWRFPAPVGGGRVVVNYPFVFEPSVLPDAMPAPSGAPRP